MVTVKLYGYLSRIVGSKTIASEGSVVKEVLDYLFEKYPEIGEEFQEGQINVIADDLSLTLPRDLFIEIKNELSLLPIIEGGSGVRIVQPQSEVSRN